MTENFDPDFDKVITDAASNDTTSPAEDSVFSPSPSDRPSLTSSSTNSSFTPISTEHPLLRSTDGSFGLDKMALRFRVAPELCNGEPDAWDSCKPAGDGRQHLRESWVRIGDAVLYLRYFELQHEAYLEFNPSKLMVALTKQLGEALPRNSAVFLCPMREGRTMARLALRSVVELVQPDFALGANGEVISPDDWPQNRLGEISVVRLDLTRDFSVGDPTWWVSRLDGIRPTRATQYATYRNPTSGMPQTVKVGTKGREVMFYNKSAQAKAAPPGVLRFEAQLRYKELKQRQLHTLGSLQPERLVEYSLWLWEYSGGGRPVAGSGRVIEQLVADPRMSWLRKARTAGHFALAAEGYELPVKETFLKDSYKAAARYGHLIGHPITGTGTELRRLDFVSGREISEQ